jgi:FkbM family methyltransferase
VRNLIRKGARKLTAIANASGKTDFQKNGELWLLKQACRHGGVLLDVGANTGQWAEKAIEINPNISVFAFEAVPEFFEKAKSRLGSRVKLYNVALSDHDGTLTVFRVGGGGRAGLGVKRKSETNGKIIEEHNVDCVRGDRFVQVQNIKQICMIKIDTDGFDMPIIRGLESTIEYDRPTVQFEYSQFWVESRFYLRDAFEFFESKDYKVGILFRDQIEFLRYHIRNETFLTNNFVAVPSERIKAFY